MIARPSGLWTAVSSQPSRLLGALSTHDARAMSLPEGEIVAEPTTPSTWIEPSASKLSLSYADLMTRPFLGESGSWSNAGIVVGFLLLIDCASHVAAHLRTLAGVTVVVLPTATSSSHYPFDVISQARNGPCRWLCVVRANPVLESREMLLRWWLNWAEGALCCFES